MKTQNTFTIIITALFVGIANMGFGQSNQFRFSVGQNLSLKSNSEWFGEGSGSYTETGYSESWEYNYLKFFNSTTIGFAWTHMSKGHFGFDLGAEYQIGYFAKYYEEKSKALVSTNPDEWSEYEANCDVKMNNIQLSPAMVYQLDLGQFQPYGRIGMIIALGQVASRYQASQNSAFMSYEDEEIYTGELAVLSLGGKLSLGTDYELSSRTRLFGEIGFAKNKMADVDWMDEWMDASNASVRFGIKLTPQG